MKAELYILGLFTFKDEDEKNIVFDKEQLNSINLNIEEELGIKRTVTNSNWVKYNLSHSDIMNPPVSDSCRLTAAEMGYYHHRVIFRFIIEGTDVNTDLREIRSKLKNFANEQIATAIIKPNLPHGFLHCDIYQLIIVHEGKKIFSKKEDLIFSNDTTTMAFDINEPNKILPGGKRYNIRISIPSTIIYTRSGVSADFQKAIINSIYQYCLYEKKEANKRNKTTDIGETQLVHLWNHIIDTMGGRTSDKNIAKISQTNYLLAFVALLIAIIAFDVDSVSEKWDYLTQGVKNIGSMIVSLFR